MRTDDFDRHIMEEALSDPARRAAALHPVAPRYGPYRSGNGPAHFPVPVLLSAISPPLLGATLLYLGYRSLRRENRWFRLGWLLSALLLASHMALDVLAATPVMAMLAASPLGTDPYLAASKGPPCSCCWACGRGPRQSFSPPGQKICP